MTLKRPLHRITPEQYIRQFLEMESTHIRRVNQLNQLYVDQHCKNKVGQVLQLPENVKPGYTLFMIEAVRPRIIKNWSKPTISETGEKAIKESFDIVFDFYGVYSGAGVEPVHDVLVLPPPVVTDDNVKA